MYSWDVIFILTGMVISGAARSVGVQLFYQLGFTFPMFVTLLYLAGQSLSLVVYAVIRQIELQVERENRAKCAETQDDESAKPTTGSSTQAQVDSMPSICENYVKLEDSSSVRRDEEALAWATVLVSAAEDGTSCQGYGDANTVAHEEESNDAGTSNDIEEAKTRQVILINKENSRRGSKSGLTEESKLAVSWIHAIPLYWKPAVPGFFNLCNSAMRWASLIYVSASVAEMLISGLELILSVAAARFIRKRLISTARWKGVGLVTLGIVLVGAIETLPNSSDPDNEASAHKRSNEVIGLLLIIGQCIMSVCQDIAEELFMQEAHFPATLLLGMEGLFGLVFGLVLYFPLAPLLEENPSEVWAQLGDPHIATYACGLTVLVLVTGIFNILATAVTSSMTRNVWKNLRTALVWLFALAIYYFASNDSLGEPWVVPDSFYFLGAFAVIVIGIYYYYNNK